MQKQYYRGHIQRHAAFWVNFRELPFEKRFAAFVKFYREIQEAVSAGECTLRDAGYALEPGDYDEAVHASSHGGDMTIALDLAVELADWVFGSRQEAEEDWGQIVLIMGKTYKMRFEVSQQDIPKPELIAKLKGLINDAQKTPLSELSKEGDYKNNPELKYPQTKSECIVSEALALLLSQDWVDDEPVLDEMVSILSQLDTGVDKPQEWQELFELAKKLP